MLNLKYRSSLVFCPSCLIENSSVLQKRFHSSQASQLNIPVFRESISIPLSSVRGP